VGKIYETLGRKVRSICNQLFKEGVLQKDAKSAYSFDFEYKKSTSLF
jgi:hypothetical protein